MTTWCPCLPSPTTEHSDGTKAKDTRPRKWPKTFPRTRREGSIGITAEIISNKYLHVFVHLLDIPRAPVYVHLCLYSTLKQSNWQDLPGGQCTFRTSPGSNLCASCPSHPSSPEPGLLSLLRTGIFPVTASAHTWPLCEMRP